MKRSMPLKNSGFAKSHTNMDREAKLAARSARMADMARGAAAHATRAVMQRVSGCVAAVPKPQPKRNPALLEMAMGRGCLLRVAGECYGGTSTTVACHSNAMEHGKAKARKADDQYSVWGCAACHRWLDQPIGNNGPTKAQKQARFALAHLDQVIEWRRVAGDPHEPARYRRAAQWALDQLNARSA